MIASVRRFRFAAVLGIALCAAPMAMAGDFGITVSGSQSVYDGGHTVSGAATDFSSMAPLTVTQAKRLGWAAGNPFAFGAVGPAAGFDNRAPDLDDGHAPQDGLAVHGSLDAFAGGGRGGSESGYDFSVTVHN